MEVHGQKLGEVVQRDVLIIVRHGNVAPHLHVLIIDVVMATVLQILQICVYGNLSIKNIRNICQIEAALHY